jgi:nucleotide-binding universal stress UspA family protein
MKPKQEVAMPKVKRILAPTDFSDLSKRGVRYALEMARDSSAEVIVYHVIDLGEERPDRRTYSGPFHDMLEDNRRLLDKFLSEGFADCIDLVEVRQVVEFGGTFKNIVDMAEQEKVDIIVMATHGRTGLDHVILGSVAEKVVARSSCPVLVVPAVKRGKGVGLAA